MTWQFWLQTVLTCALGLFAFQAKRMVKKYDEALKEKEVVLENDRQAQLKDLKAILSSYRDELGQHRGELRDFKESNAKISNASLAAMKRLNEGLQSQDELLKAVAQTIINKFDKSEVVEITKVLLRVQKKG